MKKEKKGTFTYYCATSIRKKAARRAKREGGSLSSVIEQLLEMYNEAPEWKYVETGKPVNTFENRRNDVQEKEIR